MPDSSRPDFNDAAVKERWDKLRSAARYGEMAVLRTLTSDDPLLNSEGRYDKTLLANAVARRQIDAVRLLLQLGAKTGETDAREMLRDVLRAGDEKLALLLLQEKVVTLRSGLSDIRLLSAATEGGCLNVVRLILEAGADPNATERYDEPPLVTAVRKENTAIVDLLLSYKADPNKANSLSKTGLHYAARDGNQGMIVKLVEKGAQVNLAASGGETPLSEAVEYKREAVVKYLLDKGALVGGVGDKLPLLAAVKEGGSAIVALLLARGANPNGEPGRSYKELPLIEAAGKGNDRTVNLLLDAGADVNAQASGLKKPALVAAAYAYGISADTIAKMLAKGARIEDKDYCGRTALIRACEYEHTDKAAVLLNAGADVNVVDDNGYTALYYAVEHGNTALVRELLQRGASVDAAKRSSRDTPLFKACEKGYDGIVELLLAHKASPDVAGGSGNRTPLAEAARAGHARIVKMLIAAGANIEAADYARRTPLYLAVEFGKAEVATFLMDEGASIACVNSSGKSLLSAAVAAGDTDTVKRLLNAGISPDMADHDGALPLVIAAHQCSEKMVKLLIDAGAALDLQDGDGTTALIKAASKSQTGLVRLLLAAGADPGLYDKRGYNAAYYGANYTYTKEITALIDQETARRRMVAEKNADPAERIRARVEELEKILSQGDKGARAVCSGDPEEYRAVKDDQFWLDERRHPSWNLVQFALLTENRQMLRLLAVWHGECEPEHLEDLRTLTGNKYPVYARLLRQSGFTVSAADLALKLEEKVKLIYAKNAAAADVRVALVQEADGRSKTVLYTSVSPYNTASREDVWGGLKSAFRDLGKRVTVENLKTFKPEKQKADAAPRRASGMSGPRP